MRVKITGLPQTEESTINKIADHLPTHESGGVVVGDAELEAGEVYTETPDGEASRILEDTSDKRVDEMSKRLRLTPEEVEEITGYRPKSSKTHSKAFEEASEYWNSKVKSLEKKLQKNYDFAKKSNSKYAANSLDENMKMLDSMPTQMDIFNSLFDSQESKKMMMMENLDNEFKCGGKKYAWGGTKPPYKESDTQAKQAALESYYNELKSIGYNGPIDINEMQKFMVKEYPQLVDDYMIKVDDTNKGKNNPGISRQDAFNDGLWWYRSMLPKDMEFNTQEELDSYTKDKHRIKTDRGDYYIDPWDKNAQKVYIRPVLKGQTSKPSVTNVPKAGQKNIENINGDVDKFNEPLMWYDVAGPIENIINSDRIPVRFDSPEITYQSPKYINPKPQLESNTASYNAMLEQLLQNAIGYANSANLFANKLRADNAVLGSVENQNNQIYNNYLRYEDQMRNAQSDLGFRARQAFEQKYLTSLENQRKQLAISKGDFYNTLAQNRRVNSEGDLVMSMIDFYNQKGDYNGKKYKFRSPSDSTNIVTDAKGNRYYVNPETKQTTKLK